MQSFGRLVVVLSLISSTSSAFAFDAPSSGNALEAKVLAVAPVKPNVNPVAVNAYLSSPTWTSWNAARGGRWVAQYDTLTGHPRRVYGGAIPWVSMSAPNADLERVARDFIAANQSVIGVANANLTFVDQPATPTRSGRVRYAVFDYSIDGVPVENGRLLFAVNNGNMIYWHSVNTANVPAVTTPSITADQALTNLFTYAGIGAGAANIVQQPALKLLPRNGATLLTYQLVWQTAFRVDGSEATWAAYVDALTGTVIAFADANRYLDEGAGRVRGGVRPAKANDAEVIRSFPFAAVENPFGNTATSANGVFGFRGGRTTTSLSGRFFDANCVACPSQTSASSTNGRLDLGVGGEGHIGNGISTPAERTGFFHTNVARMIANKWLDLPWLRDDEIALNVNIAATCNAYYSGNTLNFYRAGNGCANTGEIRDVMQHEWGHGLDDFDGDDPGYEAALGLGDMATGEAVGDHIALFVDHDACIGQSFAAARNTGIYTTDPQTNQIARCDGVRNLDEHRVLRGSADTRPVVSGLLTLSNVTAKCPGPPISTANPLNAAYIGPMAREGHCEGEIWGQAAYHLVYSLATGRSYGSAKFDANQQYLSDPGAAIGDSLVDGSKNPGFDRDQAWTIAERLFFESRPMVASYAPSTVQAMGPSAYDAYLVVDDTGDGLLPNGTPHAAYINDAFLHHEIHETGMSTAGHLTSIDTKDCVAPATPNVTLTQGIAAGTQAVTISWTAVAGAASYTVLRNERRDDVFLEVARVSGSTTSVADVGVDNGVTYNYRVQANAGGACFAVSAGGVKAITVAQPDPLVRRVNVNDALKGNNDGQLDAGEKAQLTVVLGNDGLAGLTNVSASLTSATSGVSVTKGGPRTFGSISAGAEAFSSSYYEVVLDPNGALCGTDAVLLLAVTSTQGAFTIPVTMPIGEAGPNCTVVGRAHAQPLSINIVSDAAGSCGDGDLTPDPGETVRVDVVVNNVGDAVARNVSVTLQSSAAYLTVTPAAVSFDTIAPLGADVRTATFLVKVGAGAPHDVVATLTTGVTSSGRTIPSTRSITTPINRDLLLQSFNFDFESGAQGWTSSDPAAGWHLTNTALTTGNSTNVWHSNYARLRCELLTGPEYEFSATSSVVFDVAVLTEEAWDGVNVQVSVDGGQTWITAPSTYDFGATGSGCMAANEGIFSGNFPTMRRMTADLSQFAGLRGRIRFKMSGDDLVDYPLAGGAWIDNVNAKAMIVSVPSAGCR